MNQFILMILAGLNMLNFAAHAQNNDLKDLSAVSFMEGEWQGEGWIIGSDRQKKYFQQNETLEFKAGHKALVIDGTGYHQDSTGVSEKIVHEAFGVISYNPDREKLTMISFSKQSGRIESDLDLTGNRQMEWSFPIPQNGARVRFREDFSKEGEWLEIGEISFDGTNWIQFFEMHLYRKS